VDSVLPNGRRDFVWQLALWLGFAAGYEVARGLADRSTAEALRNAGRVINVEQRLGGLPELALQERVLAAGALLVHAVDWTYWVAQFAVVVAGLLWIYFRRNGSYRRVRNTLFVTNTLALVGYVLLPTAPPRLVPGLGFVDTLAQSEVFNHGSGLVQLLSNSFAAMPSLHAADALIIGVALAATTHRRWLAGLYLLWPVWVSFSVLATANHYWLDVVAGAALAALGATVASGWPKVKQRGGRRDDVRAPPLQRNSR